MKIEVLPLIVNIACLCYYIRQGAEIGKIFLLGRCNNSNYWLAKDERIDMTKLAFDIDGVLANFTRAYAEVLTEHTGIEFPYHDPEFPKVWFWEREAGVTKEQEKWVWENKILTKDSKFWQNLRPLQVNTKATLKHLSHLRQSGHEIYFLTHRMGDKVKLQTEYWLRSHGMDNPTVILSGDKAPLIKHLGFDFFIDDKPETIEQVALLAAPSERNKQGWPCYKHIYLKDAPYNRHCRVHGVEVVADVREALILEGLG